MVMETYKMAENIINVLLCSLAKLLAFSLKNFTNKCVIFQGYCEFYRRTQKLCTGKVKMSMT